MRMLPVLKLSLPFNQQCNHNQPGLFFFGGLDRADVHKFLLVGQHWHINVYGSTEERHL